jgi:uridine kinase
MAHRASIPSILVETNPKNLEKALLSDPDFVRPDLLSAVQFILNDFPLLEEWVSAFVGTVRSGDVILLGGMAHSGKSTLSSVIQVVLRRAGLSAAGITLDRWILSEDHREDGVLGRYDMDKIASFLDSICATRKTLKLSLPAYNSFTKTTVEDAAQVTIKPDDVVVVDGVIALVAGRNFSAKKIFVKTREDLRLQRFLSKYALRGLSTNDAMELYESRRLDEEPIVVESENNADVSITLPLGNK